MKKQDNNKNIKNNDIIKNIIAVIIIVAIVIGLFFLSEIAGDRSKDKTWVDPNASSNSVSSGSSEEENENPLINAGESWTEDEEKEYEEITFSQFKKVLKEKELTIVLLATDSCYWCVNQKPVLRHAMYLEPDVNVKSLDVSTMTSSDAEYLAGLDESLASFGTPTFIAVKDGKVVAVQTGARDTDGLISMFEDMGAI